MTFHKIMEFYIEWFSVFPNIISKFRTAAIFKTFVKQNNDPNKTFMSMIFYCTIHWIQGTRIQTQPSRWTFSGYKNLQHTFLRMGSEPGGPML
jgi:hypothetical protein